MNSHVADCQFLHATANVSPDLPSCGLNLVGVKLQKENTYGNSNHTDDSQSLFDGQEQDWF